MKPIIELKNVTKTYGVDEDTFQVLKDINFKVYPGEMVAIMGPSGSGKSTLMNILGFLDKKYQGEYLFEGQSYLSSTDESLSQLRNHVVGFVFQNFSLIESDTVFENVELPLLYGGSTYRKTKKQVLKSIEEVGLLGKEHRLPKHLSGGQQQRVAIARSMVNNPRFLLADEPTGALDTKTSEEIMNLFKQLNEEKKVTVILVTHNPELIPFCTRLIEIRDGEIIKDKELRK